MVILITALLSTLSWSNPVDTTDFIQVEKASNLSGPFVSIAHIAPGSTAYVDANNLAGTTACYRLAYLTVNGLGPYSGIACKAFPKQHGNPHDR